ncbi:MAG: UDP-N-acetylmuramoyl-tripeptide--D-alanyl-D-alanine ligase [Candidatus Accumulibacter sp.]|jgi:UDP-N-acetylmuramoyl-tripeptide--D-alanyl-D-alanine ligase|nr:UDP-N-acetylmuramoyl-tripeptide--D-alanyl-D-alanine ligase [Accumulibacter sp.]
MSAAMRLCEAASAVGGEVVGAAGEECSFSGVSTDTRTLGAGELFIALRGEHFDGNDYVGTAVERGAAAALVASDAVCAVKGAGLPLIAVGDTRDALGRLAAHWRAKFSIPVVAVTGSNGKTTTKEMIAAILRAAWGGAVHSTEGNLNNEIGLPLTLLGLDATHRAAVVEIGMSHPGEVLELARIAQPSVALVTNAQRAHLEGLGSLEAVAAEKGALYAGMPESGVAVINADDAFYELWLGLASGRKLVRFSFERPVEVCARRVCDGLNASESVPTVLTLRFGGEEVEVRLTMPGIHNARNALGAAAAALAAGAPLRAVRDGLSAFRGVRRRLTRRRAMNGATLYDDTYNANPDSVRAGIDVLATADGKKILVFGDMGEVGDDGARLHEEVGAYAREKGVDLLFALGASSARAVRGFGGGGRHFDEADALVNALKAELSPRVTVLVKGSRFMRMERVADAVAAPDAASYLNSGES